MRLVDVDEPVGSGDVWEMWGIERPKLHEFINFCFKRFEYVIIWSAGKKRYVDRLSDRLFRNVRNDPHLVLSWDNCRKTNDNYDKPIMDMTEQFPDIADSINLETTFIVDDRSENFDFTNKDNGIHIPPYRPCPTVDGLLVQDDTLDVLMKWLDKVDVRNCEDVRDIPKAIW